MARYPTRTPHGLEAADGGVAAVDRALLVLLTFGPRDRALSLQDLADRTGMVKSTLLRMIASLQHFELVRRLDDGSYALGPTVARLYGSYTASFSLDALVPQALARLVDQTQESASFHIQQGEHRLVLYRVNSPQPLSDQSRAGDLFPINKGAGGHVIMAFTGAQGPLYEQIRREKVYGGVSDRVPELAGVSAPVFEAGNRLVGAVTLTMPKSRYRTSHASAVRACAEELTLKFGGSF
jgi:DNA-binding IclR family transcriptional regulator